jgi:hypothetical protein
MQEQSICHQSATVVVICKDEVTEAALHPYEKKQEILVLAFWSKSCLCVETQKCRVTQVRQYLHKSGQVEVSTHLVAMVSAEVYRGIQLALLYPNVNC